MKKTRMQKGITLIALIITIIILLILAVVTIGSIKNSNIIEYAQNASSDYGTKKDEEESIISGYESLIEESIGEVKYTDENVPIPVGFKVKEGTKKDGLVIEHKTEGSQFVWIPVPDIDKFVKLEEGNYRGVLYNWDTDSTGNTPYQYDTANPREPVNLTKEKKWDTDTIVNGITIKAGTSYPYDSQEMFEIYNGGTYNETMYQDSFNEMVKSVAKYGGFYVGRYETSLNGNKVQSKAGVTPMQMNNVTWYEIYRISKTYSQSGVISEMIWGCQWDAMMRFILTGDDAEHVTATDKVSHTKDDFEMRPYQTGGTNYNEVYKGTTREYEDVANNIYDLEGNVCEMTQSGYDTSDRIYYGGYYDGQYAPSNRRFSNPTATLIFMGSRLTLYIK